MLMIVALHIIRSHIELSGCPDTVSWIARSFCICAVDVYVLISGYFGIRFKFNRLVSLDLQTVFYSVSTLLLLVILGYQKLGVLDFHAFIPVLTKRYWFVTSYLVLYICSPALNRIFDNLKKEEIRNVLIIGFALFYIWPSFNALILAAQFVSDNGYGLINFIFLYLLGRYIGKYGLFANKRRIWFLIIYIVSSSLLAIIQPIISRIVGFEYKNLFAYNTIFVFISSLSLFLYFERLSFSSKLINRLAINCLAVYLLHQGPGVWEAVSDSLKFGQLRGGNYVLTILVFPIVVYFTAVIIDSVRMVFFTSFENNVSEKLKILLGKAKSLTR